MPFDSSAIQTLAAAVDTDPSGHQYVITEAETGITKGIYQTEQSAMAGMQRFALPGTVHVLTVLHPAVCDCDDQP